ncbi:aspartic peptidase domain-containing protein [Lanmaoa asiatica]|nr:aspartic peptidase domain-containing protein [Lanmaoa asiatica]
MLLRVALFMLSLTTNSFSTPLRHYTNRASRKFLTRRSPTLDRHAALAAQAATRRKFRNAPALLAGQGTCPGYAIPSSLQNTYDRASDYATDIAFLSSQPKPSYSSSAAQELQMDFDTGSAGTDLWVTVNCDDCGLLTPFQASASSTYHNTSEPFAVAYGSGDVSGTLAVDTVAIGPFKVPNQYFGAVQLVSENFADSPNDGLAGLAFGTIANSRNLTFFENLIPQLEAPLFSVFMTRTQVHGSEICFGCIDESKAIDKNVSWVQVTSKTWWTVDMRGVSVSNAFVPTTGLSAIIDTGTSFIYLPDSVVTAIYKLIPESKPAPDYGEGFYAYPCDAHIAVSFMLGSQTLTLDPRDMNLGGYTGRRLVLEVM